MKDWRCKGWTRREGKCNESCMKIEWSENEDPGQVYLLREFVWVSGKRCAGLKAILWGWQSLFVLVLGVVAQLHCELYRWMLLILRTADAHRLSPDFSARCGIHSVNLFLATLKLPSTLSIRKREQQFTHTHPHPRPPARTHARAPTHTYTHTHTSHLSEPGRKSHETIIRLEVITSIYFLWARADGRLKSATAPRRFYRTLHQRFYRIPKCSIEPPFAPKKVL